MLTLLKDFGIEPVTDDGSVDLIPEQGNVIGYWGFICSFEFDDTGKFVTVGVWE